MCSNNNKSNKFSIKSALVFIHFISFGNHWVIPYLRFRRFSFLLANFFADFNQTQMVYSSSLCYFIILYSIFMCVYNIFLDKFLVHNIPYVNYMCVYVCGVIIIIIWFSSSSSSIFNSFPSSTKFSYPCFNSPSRSCFGEWVLLFMWVGTVSSVNGSSFLVYFSRSFCFFI